MATIKDILSMTVAERKNAYKATDIEKIKIDGNEFTDYKAFSFLWEKSYVKEPERSASGVIDNLNSYATFVTPHLKIDFSMMSIDSYRVLMKLLYSKNEFVVECYDVINNEPTVNNMYFATEEMPKLWAIARALDGEEWVELLGVQDYTVEMVGTNTNFKLQRIRYYLNQPNNVSWDGTDFAEQTFAVNTSVSIGAGASVRVGEETQKIQNITFNGTYQFVGWNTEANRSGINIIDGDEYYLQNTIALYAQWKAK